MSKPVTETESKALDNALEAIEKLNESFKDLGVEPGGEDHEKAKGVFDVDPFDGLFDTPHLDKAKPSEPLLTEAELVGLRTKVHEAKTSREQFVKVVATLVKVGAALAKAAA